MTLILSLAFTLTTAGPVDTAVRATEAPNALRAAFTVEISNNDASLLYRYDPREAAGSRWQRLASAGEDRRLDAVAEAWSREAAPDGRLFADNLRANLSGQVEIDDFGSAWRVQFDHATDATGLGGSLEAEAWLEPMTGRFMRIDYALPAPIKQADGTALNAFQQSYRLETEPAWGLSYIAEYQVQLEVADVQRTQSEAYRVVVKEATFFFSTPAHEDAYRAKTYGQLAGY